MFRKTITAIFVICIILNPAHKARAAEVTTVDFLGDIEVNAAGPFLLLMDSGRNRLIAANTLSSSISIIDCGNETVRNIPIGGRGLQHLKSESFVLEPSSGRICLIGDRTFHVIDPACGKVTDIETDCQFESAALTSRGNVFLVGRETGEIGFFDSSTGRFTELDWLDRSEPLVNMNATPPPPIRKVVYDRKLGRIIALDGFSSSIHFFDPSTGGKLSERELDLKPRSRWHLAGYDPEKHALHVVLETSGRKVMEAVSIDTGGDNDIITSLPGLTEGVGICFNRKRNEVYISYDNHPTVHVIDYGNRGEISEIRIPAYGNDGAAVDIGNDILYTASWAHGEIDVIDLESRKLVKRIKNPEIIPHMFSLVFNPRTNRLYFPKGATAVNGTFGSAVTALDPETEKSWKIRTGWAPIDLIELRDSEDFMVFSSEDMFARVSPDGEFDSHLLPVDYPVNAEYSPSGKVYLSYGPHQSYWPTVYIWDARNGVLTIDPNTLEYYDRRIPRQALDMALDEEGVLYLAQNNWGRERQFITRLPDEIRLFEPAQMIELPDTVQRETTRRVLEYDRVEDMLYLLRAGETDTERTLVQIVDPASGKLTGSVEAGINGTDLTFDRDYIYVTNFGSGSVTVVRKSDQRTAGIPTGGSPVRGCLNGSSYMAVDHTGNRLVVVDRNGIEDLLSGRAEAGQIAESYQIPFEGMPDNICSGRNGPIITSHSSSRMMVIRFDIESQRFETILRFDYPFGDVSLAGSNSSFYMKGQFGDAVFSLNRIETDSAGRIWITDFLAGKLFIIENGKP